MIILTAGHTGAGTGAQCAATQFDEGAENIWLRNRVAEILTNKYGLVVLMDDDRASLKLLTKALSDDLALTENMSLTEFTENTELRSACHPVLKSPTDDTDNTDNSYERFALSLREKRSTDDTDFDAVASPACHADLKPHTENMSLTDNISLTEHTDNTEEIKTCLLGRDFAQQKQDHYVKEKSSYVFLSKNTTSKANPTVDDIIIDIHFNAHSNPQARGCETIVADDATELELRVASRLAHATADSLEIPLRGIKSESETPHRRLAMLHLTPQSIILEVCFCTSPEDVKQYRKHRRKIASTLAKNIAELVK